MSKTPIILGIDPGTQILGYAVLQGGLQPKIIMMDVLKLTKEKDIYARLQMIHAKIIVLMETYHPAHFAIEAPFFGKNVQSMLKLGRAQGVSIAAAMRHGLDVTEYSPRKVKQAVTGNGNASKEQVALMLKSLLNLKTLPKNLDATDGLAAAVCHFYNAGKITQGKSYSGWGAFVKQNPKKID